ncbi:hypothetical protein C8Q70DRAFT_937813 [Cubamyces menziesii]|nr:hypothetical protein C8Q70DRAFT_937813 [Cubamyces menziesii]
MHYLHGKRRERPQQTPGVSRGKQLAKTGLNGLIEALKLTKGASSACPPLQYAVEALLVVLEAFKAPPEDRCPQELKDRLVTLTSNTHHPNSKFNEIAEDAKDTQSKPPILRLLNAAGYAGKTESWIKKLDRHINDFCKLQSTQASME